MRNEQILSSFDWQTLKGKAYEIARQRLNEEFFEDEMIHFSKLGAQSILYSLKYLEEEFP